MHYLALRKYLDLTPISIIAKPLKFTKSQVIEIIEKHYIKK
jgi:hypothetical protein